MTTSYLVGIVSVGYGGGTPPEKGLVSSGDGSWSATEAAVKAFFTYCSAKLGIDVYPRFTIISDVDSAICRLVAEDLARLLQARQLCEVSVRVLTLESIDDATNRPEKSNECAFVIVVADRSRSADFCRRNDINYSPPQGWVECHIVAREVSLVA